ncbi:Ku protein [Rhodoferax sp. WC2427]|uniref:non-homologous end joining protein Ku n=1 Tax=Rhodoferax sp. WC2427 TaxID=3234144 RepID=UPI0034651FF3
MATTGRALWKGAISFGLVHIPVGLHTASSERGINFDWLDKRTMDPVGYKRINKKTGKEIEAENIVKGFEYEDGRYVIISPEEIESIFPFTTQTIEILKFVVAAEIPFVYLERPYYVEPIHKGQKVYALLRDTLVRTGKVGLAKVVIQTKQHLAALVPSGPVLVLNLLRWGDEVKGYEGLNLPATGSKGAKLTANELQMAQQLVEDMTGTWDPQDFQDGFRQEVMKLVDKKVKAGATELVVQPEEAAPASAEIIDLGELLARSLKGRGRTDPKAPATASTAKAAKPSAVAQRAPRKPASTAKKAA